MALEIKDTFVRGHLIATLKKLSDGQFETFKNELFKTSMKELVGAGDEYIDEPNVFKELVTVEDTVNKLIGKFGRTYALIAAATVMDKMEKRDLAKVLRREVRDLAVTSHGLKEKPKGREIVKGVFRVTTGVAIGVVSFGAVGAATAGAPLAASFMGIAVGGAFIVNGMKHIFKRK
ncbi:uncharacterized protein RBU57_017396 [Macrochelys suwanniensis]